MINKFLNHFVSCFGFECTTDFNNSIVHSKLLMITIPIAGISAVIENLLGLHSLTLIAFVVLLTLELVTGLMASKIKGHSFESHKFSRFGLKAVVWITLLYVTNQFYKEYSDHTGVFDNIASGLFKWLHGTLFIYITLEYLISVLENLGVITGDSKKSLINTIINKLNSFLKNDKN